MKDLIPITESARDGETVHTVDARLLHSVLEVGRDFSTWIKDRIEKYKFTENTDYWVFPKSGENLPGGRRAIDYALTIGMAKELAMVESGALGRTVRKYFIEAERRLKASAALGGRKEPPRLAHAKRIVANSVFGLLYPDFGTRVFPSHPDFFSLPPREQVRILGEAYAAE